MFCTINDAQSTKRQWIRIFRWHHSGRAHTNDNRPAFTHLRKLIRSLAVIFSPSDSIHSSNGSMFYWTTATSRTNKHRQMARPKINRNLSVIFSVSPLLVSLSLNFLLYFYEPVCLFIYQRHMLRNNFFDDFFCSFLSFHFISLDGRCF